MSKQRASKNGDQGTAVVAAPPGPPSVADLELELANVRNQLAALTAAEAQAEKRLQDLRDQRLRYEGAEDLLRQVVARAKGPQNEPETAVEG